LQALQRSQRLLPLILAAVPGFDGALFIARDWRILLAAGAHRWWLQLLLLRTPTSSSPPKNADTAKRHITE